MQQSRRCKNFCYSDVTDISILGSRIESLTSMARLSTSSLMISTLTITALLGCGVLPPGRMRSRNFSVTGFNLPVNMVYSTVASVRARFSGMAAGKDAAQAFLSRLVMQAVLNVLEQQGRSALLPDAVIFNILEQLMIQINYDALECKEATAAPTRNMMTEAVMMKPHCIIVGSTVTALCDAMTGRMCNLGTGDMIAAIPDNHKTFLGTLTTTNVIMANWSKEMWQSVLNRTVRMLASEPFGSHFFSAVGTIS
ncbi:hypothetical protein KIN20_011374 [Parelaphostrongylus tenuis]|uniref:Uncharacterized protein n=1 Tax=Parelaphostrongylus tenuis TaxID=148309 RepID=A0AAD5ME03_PARTN|nr:hypothetical protein KIN20_011374 [Parelaphostrongylus tenuis]